MIDWFRVIVDLHGLGLTAATIGTKLGVTAARVRGWRQYGHEPKHSDGEALLALWAQHTAKMRESAPRTVENRPGQRNRVTCEAIQG